MKMLSKAYKEHSGSGLASCTRMHDERPDPRVVIQFSAFPLCSSFDVFLKALKRSAVSCHFLL